MTVLIMTVGGDVHAANIAHVLRSMGERVILTKQASSIGAGNISIDPAQCRITIDGNVIDNFDDLTIWNRRNTKEFFFGDNIYEGDKTFLRASMNCTLEGVRALCDTAFSVNPSAAHRVLANKVNQLRAAAKIGFSIPKTLISNNYEHVHAFVDQQGVVCVKPLVQAFWYSSRQRGSVAYTVAARSHDLLDRGAIELCPAIYQEKINPRFEVRVTAFGRHISATKISIPAYEVPDWRAHVDYSRDLSTIEAPSHVAKFVFEMLSALGLRFGTFDFIVDRSGEWVFLEVNEAGQFLWQEEYVAGDFLLEPFARYLMSRDDNFQWSPQSRNQAFGLAAVDQAMTLDADIAAFLASPSAPEEAFGVVSEEFMAAAREQGDELERNVQTSPLRVKGAKEADAILQQPAAIVMYSLNDCPPCDRLEQALTELLPILGEYWPIAICKLTLPSLRRLSEAGPIAAAPTLAIKVGEATRYFTGTSGTSVLDAKKYILEILENFPTDPVPVQ